MKQNKIHKLRIILLPEHYKVNVELSRNFKSKSKKWNKTFTTCKWYTIFWYHLSHPVLLYLQLFAGNRHGTDLQDWESWTWGCWFHSAWFLIQIQDLWYKIQYRVLNKLLTLFIPVVQMSNALKLWGCINLPTLTH